MTEPDRELIARFVATFEVLDEQVRTLAPSFRRFMELVIQDAADSLRRV